MPDAQDPALDLAALRAWCDSPAAEAQALAGFPLAIRALAALAAARAVAQVDNPDPRGRRPQRLADALETWLRNPGPAQAFEVRQRAGAAEEVWNDAAGDGGQPAPTLQAACYAGWVVTDPDQRLNVVHALGGAALALGWPRTLEVVRGALRSRYGWVSPAPPASARAAGEVRAFGAGEMAWIPPGSFWMGSHRSDNQGREQRPQRRVEISRGLWLGVAPVTQGLWEAVTGNNASFYKGDAQLPVHYATWCDAVAFANLLSAREGLPPAYRVPEGFALGMDAAACDALHSQVQWDPAAGGYRLPTEAEWEYAARAGTTTRCWSGDLKGDLARVGWVKENSGDRPQPVGQKPANPWGLRDVHGNVEEWCYDAYLSWRELKRLPLVDPVQHQGRSRVVRGGHWGAIPSLSRSASRSGVTPSRGLLTGLRLARSDGEG